MWLASCALKTFKERTKARILLSKPCHHQAHCGCDIQSEEATQRPQWKMTGNARFPGFQTGAPLLKRFLGREPSEPLRELVVVADEKRKALHQGIERLCALRGMLEADKHRSEKVESKMLGGRCRDIGKKRF